MDQLLQHLQAFRTLSRLGVLYTPGEKNSESQLRHLQAAQHKAKLQILPVIIRPETDLAVLLPQVAHQVDGLFLTGSGAVGHALPAVLEIAHRQQVVTATILEDYLDQGVLLGICADQYRVGRQAGELAARILKGAKPASLPVARTRSLNRLLNLKAAEAGHFEVPPAFLKTVTKTKTIR
jgi:putative ABC transport system substrate-binding protein